MYVCMYVYIYIYIYVYVCVCLCVCVYVCVCIYIYIRVSRMTLGSSLAASLGVALAIITLRHFMYKTVELCFPASSRVALTDAGQHKVQNEAALA